MYWVQTSNGTDSIESKKHTECCFAGALFATLYFLCNVIIGPISYCLSPTSLLANYNVTIWLILPVYKVTEKNNCYEYGLTKTAFSMLWVNLLCRISFIVIMLNVIMLNVIMLNVIMPSVVGQSGGIDKSTYQTLCIILM
jgi:hypothetical protein